MLLKIRGYELEIVRGKFVCFSRDDGETTYFSEWNNLDPKLQEKFRTVREELSEMMEDFISSNDRAAFEAISEEYKKDQPAFDDTKT